MGSAASAMDNGSNSPALSVPEDLVNWTNFPISLPRSVSGDEKGATNNFRSWEFDIWQLSDDELLPLSMNIAKDFNFPEQFGFDTSVWCNFVWEIQRLMGTSTNPYHNYRHVIDVAQTCACIVKEFSASVWLNDLDVFALYVSALVHDLEHPGTNNVYQVNACTPLAIRYNDISVLENHHCARAFDVFMLPKCNIAQTMKPEQRKYLRKTIIALVLITDMTQHFNLRGELEGLITRYAEDVVAAKLDDKDTLVVLKSIIHTADISNPAKPWAICKRWSDLVLEEFLAQGDLEKAEGLPVSMNCDRDTTQQDELSMNFTDFIVAPFFFSMAKLLPKMLSVCKILDANRTQWHEMYTTRATAQIADETARQESLVKWEARRVGHAEKMTALEKSVHAIWMTHPVDKDSSSGDGAGVGEEASATIKELQKQLSASTLLQERQNRSQRNQ